MIGGPRWIDGGESGRLDVTRALTSRQVAVKANPFDLLKLRKLL